MSWLIAYDVSCPRRWRRLYRLVRDHGARVQWSVFAVTDPRFRPEAFLAAAAKVIDRREDDVRLYRLAGKISGSTDRALLAPIPGVHWTLAARCRKPPLAEPLDGPGRDGLS